MTIKEARYLSGLTQKEVSVLLEIPLRTLENWESGVRVPPVYVEKLIVEKLVSVKKERGQEDAKEAFNNREGQITGIRESSHCLSFGGDENLYGCLQLGMLELEDNKEFLMCVRDWKWVDEEYPEENYNVWRIMARSL